MKATLPCAINGCDRGQYARGWCKPHHANWSFNGDPHSPARPACTVEGCQKPARTNGGRRWCSMHQERLRTKGTTSANKLPVGQRFQAFVDNSGDVEDCHEWQGSRDGHGYGRFRIGGRTQLAHRWILGHLRGHALTDDEKALHHCDNPPCCNPRHLYIGTQTENMQDAVQRNRLRPWNANKQVCDNGHDLTPANVYIAPNGTRKCRTCRADAQRRYLERRRNASQSPAPGLGGS